MALQKYSGNDITLVPHRISTNSIRKSWVVHGCDFNNTSFFSTFARNMKHHAHLSGHFLLSSDNGIIHRLVFSLHIQFFSKNHPVNKLNVNFVFDNKFNLIQIHKQYLKSNNDIIKNTASYTPVGLENELLMIKIFIQGNDCELAKLLPELCIPSAYDFSTDDFAKRIKVAGMIDY